MFVVFMAGSMVSFASFKLVENQEAAALRTHFEDHATGYASAIQTGIERNLEIADALGSFFVHAQIVTRDEFYEFTKDLLVRHKEIQALEWIPRVKESERALFERNAREEGFASFMFTEKSGAGQLVKATGRDEYYPVYFVEPLKGNEAALGYNLGSDIVRMEAIEKARDTGKTIATGRITLVQEKGSQYGILIFRPVYKFGTPSETVEQRRSNLIGFSLIVLKAGDFVEQTLSKLPDYGIGFKIYDGLEASSANLLYSSGSEEENLSWRHSQNIPGRFWLIIFTTGPEYMKEHFTSRAYEILAFGLITTLIAEAYLYTVLRKTAQMEIMSGNLSDTNEALMNEITIRKRSELTLRESEDELRSANTELEKTLRDLHSAQNQLLRSEKMAAIGVLSSGVAHEIKNPLNIISSYVQLLMMEDAVKPETMETYNIIMKQVGRAAKITDNLRFFARERKPEIKKIDLGEFLEKTLALVEYEMKLENISVERRFHQSPLYPYCDEDQLAQVFLNLIGNARDSMNEKQADSSWEELMASGWEGKLTVETTVTDGKAVIAVSDTGMGIPENERKLIFDPFFTTKEEGKGTGLGLSIAYGIMESHGGSIELSNSSPQGSRFTLTLPLDRKEAEGE